MPLPLPRSLALPPLFSKVLLSAGLAMSLAFAGPAPAALAKDKTVPLAGILKPGTPISFADLIEKVSPAVVSITVETREDAPQINLPEGLDQLPEPFRDFFRRQMPGQGMPQKPREGRALGSGFLISPKGYVVTNNHVIRHAAKMTVVMQDGREFDAKLIGHDKLTDLAVLKIEDDKPLPYVSFAEDVKLRVGDWVVAVGNPFGLGGTATAGIVSATGREIGPNAYDFIQIDASINRGNSGGPTFDLYGNVVGVNSQILSPTGGNIGIGFAIPAHVAEKVTRELIKNGVVTRGYLGVSIQSLDKDLAESVGLSDHKGALVAKVFDGSPAKKAGFKVGDIIIRLDGREVLDSRDLTRRVGELYVGHKAKFVILRDSKRKTLVVTIGKRPENLGEEPDNAAPAQSSLDEFGMKLGKLTPEDRKRLELQENRGILVEQVETGSIAFKKGLRAGDALLVAGSTDLHSPADFERAVQAARKAGRKAIRVLVQNRNGQLFTALRLDETKKEEN